MVWIERTITPGFDEIVHLFRRPRVLDVDDAIWLEGITGRSAATMARAVDAVIAGNEYLADWASKYCDTVHIVPTAVDSQQFRPRPRSEARTEARFVIGWMGSTATLKYVEGIQDALAKVLRAIPGASLLIVANDEPRMPALGGLPMRFIRWSPTTEVEALVDMDVGLMPLPDDEYTRGKCSLKLLQYMAGGLPIVASPVGMNRDLLQTGDIGIAASSTSDWVDALLYLHQDAAVRKRMGEAGRSRVERDFDVLVITARLAAIFKGLN